MARSLVLEGPRDLRLGGEERTADDLCRAMAFDDAVEADRWLDEHPDEAITVALTYDGDHP